MSIFATIVDGDAPVTRKYHPSDDVESVSCVKPVIVGSIKSSSEVEETGNLLEPNDYNKFPDW